MYEGHYEDWNNRLGKNFTNNSGIHNEMMKQKNIESDLYEKINFWKKYIFFFLFLLISIYLFFSSFLFVKEDGGPLYPKLVYNIVHKHLKSIPTVRRKSPHVLRHSFATGMLWITCWSSRCCWI